MYELYGHNGRSDSYKHVANRNAKQKSKVNELTRISFQNIFLFLQQLIGLQFKMLCFMIVILMVDRVILIQSRTLNKRVRDNLIYKSKIQSISLFNTITSSKKRWFSPIKSSRFNLCGLNYFRIFDPKFLGKFKLNYDYKHYGKAFDYDPGIKGR